MFKKAQIFQINIKLFKTQILQLKKLLKIFCYITKNMKSYTKK